MFTCYLNDTEINAIFGQVGANLRYNDSTRQALFSGITFSYVGNLTVNSEPNTQLLLDLKRLNCTERLTDGTVPFLVWLDAAALLLQSFPGAAKAIQDAQAKIQTLSVKATPVAPTAAPGEAARKAVQEKIISQNDMVSFGFLQKALDAGRGVAKILVPKYEDGAPVMLQGSPLCFSGTAWLLTGDLAITNHHVINARADSEPDADAADFTLQAEHASVLFDFNDDNQQGNSVGVAKMEAADAGLDFAIVRLNADAGRNPPGRFPNPVMLIAERPQAVNIIQHPRGYAKKVAMRNNHLYKADYPKVHYFTDTEKGSSGSPVFNDDWRVIALHRASTPADGVIYQGMTTAWVNEGVQLRAIFDFLAQHKPALSIEILNS